MHNGQAKVALAFTAAQNGLGNIKYNLGQQYQQFITVSYKEYSFPEKMSFNQDQRLVNVH